jgi:mono/diheme cytochrome c family protein
MRFIAGFIAALIVICIAGLIYIYSGAFNVAATAADPKILEWILSTTMDRSVSQHAKEIQAPAQLTDEQARQGYAFYNQTCVHCHGAPGKDAPGISKGLNPEPPSLTDVSDDWSPAELFWIVKSGIKMSGMPAFGPTRKDEEIWNVVALVQRMKKDMTAAEFNQFNPAPAASAPAPAAPQSPPQPAQQAPASPPPGSPSPSPR